ncbi:hypothetical protein IGI46_003872 [Enterococcus sp. AZ163]|uniref:Uncharacterized protein n=1 Tax=Candidatus Enterococcus ferrettii TaxID=2815324 RepID=A0ABV0EX05_9ENTE
MGKRIQPLSDNEKKRFMRRYSEIRNSIKNRGIRRFILVIASTIIYLTLRDRLIFLETSLKFIVLLFLVGTLKSFGHMMLLDRIYAWFKKYSI